MTYEELKVKYPELLSNPYCGFSCGSGWYNLLDNAFELISGRIESIKSYNDWVLRNANNPKLDQELLKPKNEINPKVAQVKEKFGTLRLYMDCTDHYIEGVIAMTESMSHYTCEECGMPGSLRTEGWYKTLCDTCHSPEGREHYQQKRNLEYARVIKELREKRLKKEANGNQEV